MVLCRGPGDWGYGPRVRGSLSRHLIRFVSDVDWVDLLHSRTMRQGRMVGEGKRAAVGSASSTFVADCNKTRKRRNDLASQTESR